MLTAETVDLVGTWRLVSVTDWVDGAMRNPEAMGSAPDGYITYTPSGRVHVVLDRRSRPPVKTGSPFGGEPIFAYAGPYVRNGGTVVHHLDMCSTLEDIGGAYVRRIEVDGEHLVLCTEPAEINGKLRVSKIKWARIA